MDIPAKVTDVLMLPFLCLFFGIVVYGLAFASGWRTGKLPWARWVGFALSGLAFILGFKTLWNLFDRNTGFIYRQALSGTKKMIYAHYAVAIIPVIVILCLVGAELWFKRAAQNLD